MAGNSRNVAPMIDGVPVNEIFTSFDGWGNPKGGMSFDGINDYTTTPSNANLSLDTDFTIERCVSFRSLINSSLTTKWVVAGNQRTYLIDIYNSSLRFIVSEDGVTNKELAFNISSYSTNKMLYFLFVYKASQEMAIYINNVKVASSIESIPSSIYIGDANLIAGYYADGGRWLNGNDYMTRFFNCILTESERLHYFNNGKPFEAPILDWHLGGEQTILTSGTLTIGKKYRIVNYISDDNFTNIGASSNATDIEFIATGTTPTKWTNSSQLKKLGCTYEILPENMGRLGVFDSQNGNHGTTLGSPVSLTAGQRANTYRDIKLTITGNTTLTNVIPKGYKLKDVIINNTTANAVTISLGTQSSGTEVINAQACGSGLSDGVLVQKIYSLTADQTLFIHSAGWNSSSLNVTFICERIGG